MDGNLLDFDGNVVASAKEVEVSDDGLHIYFNDVESDRKLMTHEGNDSPVYLAVFGDRKSKVMALSTWCPRSSDISKSDCPMSYGAVEFLDLEVNRAVLQEKIDETDRALKRFGG